MLLQQDFLVVVEPTAGMDNKLTSERIHEIASRKCAPCKTIKPYSVDEVVARLNDFPGWSFESGSIQKEFRFKSYLSGLEFAYALGKVAEAEDHHPDILVGWRRVRLILSTHAVKGLSPNDFIMAAKSEIEYSKAIR